MTHEEETFSYFVKEELEGREAEDREALRRVLHTSVPVVAG